MSYNHDKISLTLSCSSVGMEERLLTCRKHPGNLSWRWWTSLEVLNCVQKNQKISIEKYGRSFSSMIPLSFTAWL